MIYTPMTKRAMKLCFEAHKDQVDKSGIPYVFHPIHLAEQMQDEETTIVALLHDVIEDTKYTIDDLRELGFSENILISISLMTHDDTVPYMEYIEQLKKNRIAAIVKRADLIHNSELSRLERIDEKTMIRVKKYKQAIDILDNR